MEGCSYFICVAGCPFAFLLSTLCDNILYPMTANSNDKLLTLTEARLILRNIVSQKVFRRWIREGVVRCHAHGKRKYFFESELIEDIKKM